MKEQKLNEYVICKIRAWHVYYNDKKVMKGIFNEGIKDSLSTDVVGYVVGKYDPETKKFNIGISMVSENDMNKEYIIQENKPINIKKSLNIAINKLNSNKVNTNTYKRLEDKTVFFSYHMARVMKYTLAQTVFFVVNKLMKKHKITDIDANQIKVRF